MTTLNALVLVLACVGLIPQEPAVQEREAKVEQNPLQGMWNVEEAWFNGKKMSVEQSKKRQLKFSDKGFTAYDSGKEGRTVKYTLGSKDEPRHIDLTTGSVGKPSYGLYEIEGDVLRICYSEPGAERPKELKSEPDSRLFLLVLKKVVEEKK